MPPDHKALVTIRNADLGYPGTRVLCGIDLTIRSADYLLLLGANGSGKSTIVRTLLGELPPRSGSLERSAGLQLAYVPQKLALDPLFPLSVHEVVEMGLWRGRYLTKRPPAADRDRVTECLDLVEIGHRSSALFSRLSGGQQQRVLLARALVSQPDMLLLDEPTSGIDARAVGIITRVMREKHEAGMAIVHVTHHPDELFDHVTRIIVAGDGCLTERPAEAPTEGAER